MNDSINVLFQSSDAFAPVTGVSITSMLENNKHLKSINIYMLNNGISEVNRHKIECLVESYGRDLYFLDATVICEKLDALKVPKWGNSYTTYCKLFVAKMLPDSIERILYLDSDTIVCGPLDELIAVDLSDSPCAMVLDSILKSYKLLIGLDEDELYFNAGVVLFNMRYWREHGCEEQILSHIKKPENNFFAVDMDLLNMLFSKKIVKLPLKYDVCSAVYMYKPKELCQIYTLDERLFYSLQEIEAARAQPVICHFTGGGIGGRPWEEQDYHPISPEWKRYLALSPWNGLLKLPSNWPAYLKLQRISYHVLPSFIYVQMHRASLHRFFKQKLDAIAKSKKEY